QQLIALKSVKGVLHATHKIRETKTYVVKNRSPQARTLIIEHPFREGWKLMEPEKPMETTRDLHRFEIAVQAGKSVVQRVTEEFTRVDNIALNSTNDETIRLFLNSNVSNDEARKALKDVLERRAKLHDTQRELASVQQQLKDITEDQGRLRANLDKVPPTSAAYKRYLEKFDKQEPVIESFQKEIKKMNENWRLPALWRLHGRSWSGPSVSRGRVYDGTGNTLFNPTEHEAFFPKKHTGVLYSFGLPGEDEVSRLGSGKE